MSRKTIFAVLIAVCLMTSVIYLADMKFVSPRLAGIPLWNLTHTERLAHLKLIWSSNAGIITVQQEAVGEYVNTSSFGSTPSGILTDLQVDPAEKRTFPKSVSKNTTRSLLITQANNSSTSLTPEVLLLSSMSMTFNTTLVRCKESPYVDCSPPKLKPIPGKIFKIAYLRRPKWIPQSELDVTGCKISQCVVDENKIPNDTDIVVIYGVGLRDNYPMPQRWPHQLYAIQVWEPPMHTHADFIRNRKSPWNKQINIIMSYRLDGDAVFPYSRLRFNPTPLGQRPNYYEIAKNKTRTAVWIVSHCKTHSRREDYVKEMQKHIDVDIFGSCGTPCTMKNTRCKAWTTTYKFYLSFENSLCTDYVTEKFFKLFYQNLFVIPVVRGVADYDTHFPSFTYINSAHFKTPKDLALHLKDLAADLDTYSKYLEYKDLYQIAPYENVACKMCTYAHTQKLPTETQTYNLQSMLGNRHCHGPKDL